MTFLQTGFPFDEELFYKVLTEWWQSGIKGSYQWDEVSLLLHGASMMCMNSNVFMDVSFLYFIALELKHIDKKEEHRNAL